ncbi:TPA: hypothetical protein ACT5CR_006876 [Burkholderia cenocepacia]
MKEPILSREEVEALAHRICMKYVHSDNEYLRQYTFGMLTLEQFAQAYEAALLEKLCGEPVPYGYEFLDMAGTNHFVRGSLPDYAQSEIVPLYTLKDRQS